MIRECPFRTGVTCGWADCRGCGWNPVVEAERKEKLRRSLVIFSKPETRGKWYIGSGAFPVKKMS